MLPTIPTPTKSGSDDTNLPRRLASHSSLWYIGTVLVSMPVPMPVTYRATIICATEYDVHCRIAPIIFRRVSNAVQHFSDLSFQLTIQAIANHMQTRLPSFSPIKNVRMHPEKAPRLYIATMMPSSALLGCPKVLRQSSLPTIPEKTPWS